MDTVALFIDGANMFYTQKKLGWNLDYKKIYDYFKGTNELYNAFYYVGTKENNPMSDSFLRALIRLGYTVRTKPVKQIWKKGVVEDEKCNLDVEIVIDMFNTVDHYSLAYLFSGDSDFERAIELLRSKGKRIIAVSTAGMASIELINAVDRFIDLNSVRTEVEKK